MKKAYAIYGTALRETTSLESHEEKRGESRKLI